MKRKTKKELKELFDAWMKEAEKHAREQYGITIADDEDFLLAVKAYHKYNYDPDTAVKAAVLLFKNLV